MLAILLEGVRRWPWFVWPLQGVAVGLLAAAVAWCLDEPVGTVVDAVPRSLWWRTAARSVGIASVVAAWSLGVWSARDGMFGHPWAVWVQGLAGGAVGASWATWRRALGVRTPGIAFGAVAVPIAALWAVLRPFARDFPVFPYADEGDWAASTTGWVVVGAVASVGLALVLADSRWWRIGTGAAPPSLPISGRLRRRGTGLVPQGRDRLCHHTSSELVTGGLHPARIQPASIAGVPPSLTVIRKSRHSSHKGRTLRIDGSLWSSSSVSWTCLEYPCMTAAIFRVALCSAAVRRSQANAGSRGGGADGLPPVALASGSSWNGTP
jgi:hypothetical protein